MNSNHTSPALASPGLAFAMLMAVLALAGLDQTIVSTALPAIAQDLGDPGRATWVFSAYLIASTVAVPLYGRLADLYRVERVLWVAIGAFLLGSMACGLSQNIDQLIAARALQGAGGGGLMTLTMVAVLHGFAPRLRGRCLGLLGSAYGLSTLLGPLVGGFLLEVASWRWAFFVNVPIGLAALGVLVATLRTAPERHDGSVDILGASLLGASLVALLLGTRANSAIELVVSAVLAAAFLWAETRARTPLLPLALFRDKGFAAANAVSVVSGVSLFATVVFLPLLFQKARGMGPALSGLHLLPFMIGITIGAQGSGRVLSHNGRTRGVALVGSAVMVFAFALLAAVVPHASAAWLSACLLPVGLGIGAVMPLVTMVSQDGAPPQQKGIATAAPMMFRAIGGAIGISVLAAVLTSSVSHEIARLQASGVAMPAAFADAFASALQPVFAAVAGVCVLAFAASLALPRVVTARMAPARPNASATTTA